MLGGNGVVVQIDEGLFRVSFITSQKITEEELPPMRFGYLDISVSSSWRSEHFTPDRTLLPIITQHVRPGTVVNSDQWAAYDQVQQLQPVNVHQTVNHSLHFVDPATGVHTHNIESYWNRVKRRFKHMKGIHETMLNSYINEFMWRVQHGRSAATALTSLCHDIALRYP